MKVRFYLSIPVLWVLAIGIAVATMGEPALAQTCADSSYSYDASCGGNSIVAGSTVTASSTVSVAAKQTAGLVFNRVSSFRASGKAPGNQQSGAGTIKLFELGSGKNAGNSDTPVGIWADGAWSKFDGSKAGSDFDGHAVSGMIGGDVTLDRWIVGLAMGYENTDVDTKFNNGNVSGNGYTVAPYAAYRIDNTFSVDALLGFSWLNYDQNRIDPAVGTQVTGSTNANRYFGGANVVGNWSRDQVNLSGKVGTFYLSERQGAFTESDGTAVARQTLNIGTVSVGGRVGYQLDMVEPYVSAEYGYDYRHSEGTYDGENSFGGAVGVALDAGNGFTGTLEGNYNEKDSVTSYGGSLFLRYNLEF